MPKPGPGRSEFTENASPPCYAHEFEPYESLSGESLSAPDRQASIDVARWRKAERARLIAARKRIPANFRRQAALDVAAGLDRLIVRQAESIVSLYWPIQGEVNLRHWMRCCVDSGMRIGLPVVESKGGPLKFRRWTPETPLQAGVWRIPVPIDGEELVPTIVIAPLVGYDRQGYRLGYGGGYFDRTLASLAQQGRRPLRIGVGFDMAALATIYPQAHDIPMDWIVTPSRRIAYRLPDG